jgi:hypothetical protein
MLGALCVVLLDQCLVLLLQHKMLLLSTRLRNASRQLYCSPVDQTEWELCHRLHPDASLVEPVQITYQFSVVDASKKTKY